MSIASPKGEVEGIGLAVALFLLKLPGFFSRCLLSLSARGLEGERGLVAKEARNLVAPPKDWVNGNRGNERHALWKVSVCWR